jgi:hypothetical protein
MSSSVSNIPRCQHIKINGTQCGSPALRSKPHCYFHQKWHEQRIVINSRRARQARVALDFPVLEDANAVQVCLMQVMRLALTGRIDQRTTGLMLYALQTASANLRHTDFEPCEKKSVVIDTASVKHTGLGSGQWDSDTYYDPPPPEPKPSRRGSEKYIMDDEDDDQDPLEGILRMLEASGPAEGDPDPLPEGCVRFTDTTDTTGMDARLARAFRTFERNSYLTPEDFDQDPDEWIGKISREDWEKLEAGREAREEARAREEIKWSVQRGIPAGYPEDIGAEQEKSA